MAKGWINSNSKPKGRESFGYDTDIMRPGKFPDGQDRMGTTSDQTHSAANEGYLSKAGRAYRATHRGDTVPHENGTDPKTLKRRK